MEVRQWSDHFYVLEDPRVRMFLMLEEGRAVLIDTGFPDSGTAEAVRNLTTAPVEVVLTHADWDHTGGLADFGAARLNRAEWERLDGVALSDLAEGDHVRCADFDFEVIEIPGHTPGSVALYDRAKNLLLSGDSVQKEGPIYMFGPYRDLDCYIASLEKLAERIPEDATVIPCHSSYPIDASYITKNLEDARALRDGNLQGTPHAEMPCQIFHGRWTAYLYNPEI